MTRRQVGNRGGARYRGALTASGAKKKSFRGACAGRNRRDRFPGRIWPRGRLVLGLSSEVRCNRAPAGVTKKKEVQKGKTPEIEGGKHLCKRDLKIRDARASRKKFHAASLKLGQFLVRTG